MSDVTGQTGMAIIKAILAGERDPVKLAQFRHPSCHSSQDEIAASLEGNCRAEHLFSLKQAVELFEFYRDKIADCEREIAEYIEKLPWRRDDEPPVLGQREKRHKVSFDVRSFFFKS